jgi:hypothetical protein
MYIAHCMYSKTFAVAEKCVVPRLLLGLLNIELRKFRRHIEHARTSSVGLCWALQACEKVQSETWALCT